MSKMFNRTKFLFDHGSACEKLKSEILGRKETLHISERLMSELKYAYRFDRKEYLIMLDAYELSSYHALANRITLISYKLAIAKDMYQKEYQDKMEMSWRKEVVTEKRDSFHRGHPTFRKDGGSRYE